MIVGVDVTHATIASNVCTGFVRNLLEPLKDGRVRLLLNAGDHVSMQESLKACLEEMGVEFKVTPLCAHRFKSTVLVLCRIILLYTSRGDCRAG